MRVVCDMSQRSEIFRMGGGDIKRGVLKFNEQKSLMFLCFYTFILCV